ncbi:MAG: radical SAM protein [Deltaproteobacteria bacterium]|nr:radical SAM protein [Deltaproteobacteria bacterium]
MTPEITERFIQCPPPGVKNPGVVSGQDLSGVHPFIIPIFLPHAGCPHRCVFCNQRIITRSKRNIPSSETIRREINSFLKYKGNRKKFVQIAFYGGNFLGLEKNDLKRLLQEAENFVSEGKVDSIRFSTRPDTISDEKLDILRSYTVSTVELGVQSMDEEVLKISKRGHTTLDTDNAAGLLREQNYEIGMQMMIGLPGDDETKALETARLIADLSPGFVRIYPTVVLADSLLARWYEDGKYTPLSLDTAVTLAKKLYLLFTASGIRVVRMGLQASEDFDRGTLILAGPYHPAFGHLVFSEIFLDMAVSRLETERAFRDVALIRVHPRNVSRIRGLKNRNIEILKKKFNLNTVQIIPDGGLEEDQLIIG